MHLPDFDELFSATDGVFTPAMAKEHGFSPRVVRRWIESKRVVRVGGRALVRAGTTITVNHRAMAVLVTWPDAVVCYITAAVLHGIPIEDDGKIHVLVPDTRHALRGFTVHRWSIRPTGVVRLPGMPLVPLTDWRTTLADCLGRLPDDDAWGLLAWMWTHDQMTEADLAAQVTDRFHLYGIVRLRLMLTAVRRRALSVGELHLQDFLNERGFVGWVGDFHVERDGRVIARGDVGFRAQRLIVEFDGKLAHNPRTKKRDARRDRRINAAGYDVLHVTWAILYEHRGDLFLTIRAMLAAPPRSRRRRELAEALESGKNVRRLVSERADRPTAERTIAS